MRYRFLGTAAAEGIPALFCNCSVCSAIRAGNGYDKRDIRTRSQSMINDDLLIDLPPDTNYHTLENNLRLGNVRYLLLTHPHMDHLYPQELLHRDGMGHGRELKYDKLEIFCSALTKEVLLTALTRLGAPQHTLNRLSFHVLSAYESADTEEYEITALPARHMAKEGAFLYLIKDKRENKTVFHCNDTGLFDSEIYRFMTERGVHIDFAELDGTLPSCPGGVGHMNYAENKTVKAELLQRGIADCKTVFYLNHFTHNDYTAYERHVKNVKADGFSVSYDGLFVEF